MSKYKPMLVHFDKAGYDEQVKFAEFKKTVSDEAWLWIGENLPENHKIIHADEFKGTFIKGNFVSLFKKEFLRAYRDKIKLDISVDKLLELMEVEIYRLEDLEREYNLVTTDIEWGAEGKHYNIDKRPYEIWTKSSEENQLLKDGRNLIEAVEKLGKHTKVYPQQIMLATSNLIGYDLRKQEYKVMLHHKRV